MTNLTEQDLKRIAYIENYLAQLHTVLPNAPAFDLTQPIDTTEGEYVRCIEWNGELYTAGKIYHVVNGIIIDNRGFNDDYADLIKHQPFFEPATHAEFLAQEQAPIETEQRWIVEVQPFADHRDDVKIVVTLNDGFISKSSGRQLAEAIKKYLNIE
jgi:hypothetical protein